MGILGTLLGLGVAAKVGTSIGNSIGREANSWYSKSYTRDERTLYAKYATESHAVPRLPMPDHPRYLNFITEYNALNAHYGKPAFMSVEAAKEKMEAWEKNRAVREAWKKKMEIK